MKLITAIDSRVKVIQSGANIGKTKHIKRGTFECPACKKHVDRDLSNGNRAKSCGGKGCSAATSTLYGRHRKKSGVHRNDIPYYKPFRAFHKRSLEEHINASERFKLFATFHEDMFDEYVRLRESGISQLTLIVTNDDTISASNSEWVTAVTDKVFDYAADRAIGNLHTRMLAVELGMAHYDVLKTIKRMSKSFGETTECTTVGPRYLNKNTVMYSLTAYQYARVIDKLADL